MVWEYSEIEVEISRSQDEFTKDESGQTGSILLWTRILKSGLCSAGLSKAFGTAIRET